MILKITKEELLRDVKLKLIKKEKEKSTNLIQKRNNLNIACAVDNFILNKDVEEKYNISAEELFKTAYFNTFKNINVEYRDEFSQKLSKNDISEVCFFHMSGKNIGSLICLHEDSMTDISELIGDFYFILLSENQLLIFPKKNFKLQRLINLVKQMKIFNHHIYVFKKYRVIKKAY